VDGIVVFLAIEFNFRISFWGEGDACTKGKTGRKL